MKTSIALNALALMCLTSAAQASYFQVNCSNAEGTIKTAGGHSQNYIQLTKRSYSDKGPVEIVIREENGKVHVAETLKTVQLVSEQRQVCKPGEVGFASSHVVNASVVTIVNSDGSLFDKEIVGVSQDLKTVRAELICENNMNAMIMCPKK